MTQFVELGIFPVDFSIKGAKFGSKLLNRSEIPFFANCYFFLHSR